MDISSNQVASWQLVYTVMTRVTSRLLSHKYFRNVSGQVLIPCRSNSTSLKLANEPPKQTQSPSISIKAPETLISWLDKYARLFPKDTKLNFQIEVYKSLVRKGGIISSPQPIKVGIIYSNEQSKKSSKILEALLADPLSQGNEIWYRPIETRPRVGEIQFKYKKENQSNTNSPGLYTVLSPILNPNYRRSFSEAFKRDGVISDNSCELAEINDSKDVDFSKYHFLINVVKEVDEIIHINYPSEIQSKILLNVIDNIEYTPVSTESTPITFDNSVKQHTIKINSDLVWEGIDQFLRYDTQAATQYIDAIRNSNILELQKALTWYLSSEKLSAWILHNIRDAIVNSGLSPKELEDISEIIKNEDVTSFSQSAHSEFQNALKPQSENFFLKRLNWWKLYYKNDNVEYDLKDFFNESFMNHSIERYNFLRGQISTRLQKQNFDGPSDINNPLFDLKNEIINNRISTEIQPKVYKVLGTAFIHYQLPISVISFLSYQHFGFSANAAVALGLLGWVVGFNQVSKAWTSFSTKWLNDLFEEVRLCIDKKCIDDSLLKEINVKYDKELALSATRQKVIQAIEKEL